MMKFDLAIPALAALAFLPFSAAHAGEESFFSSKHISYIEEEPLVPYEAGRGLITLEGPSGLFISPTSATLPEGAFTAQYCVFFPNHDTVVGHGALLAYGVSDWLEVGGVGNYVNVPGDNILNGGPFARVRLLKHDGIIPQVGVGGYAKFGDNENYGSFAAAYWRIPIDENGFLKAIGIHAGARYNWFDADIDDQFRGYGGLEFQLPLRIYLVGEISTKDDADADVPYAFGLQWRAGLVNISVAGIQNGNLDEPSFYFGIGTALSF